MMKPSVGQTGFASRLPYIIQGFYFLELTGRNQVIIVAGATVLVVQGQAFNHQLKEAHNARIGMGP